MWISKRGTYFKFDMIFRIHTFPVNYARLCLFAGLCVCVCVCGYGWAMTCWLLELLCIFVITTEAHTHTHISSAGLFNCNLLWARICVVYVTRAAAAAFDVWIWRKKKVIVFHSSFPFINGSLRGKSPFSFSFNSKFSINLF